VRGILAGAHDDRDIRLRETGIGDRAYEFGVDVPAAYEYLGRGTTRQYGVAVAQDEARSTVEVDYGGAGLDAFA
jgi:hypothetical protein